MQPLAFIGYNLAGNDWKPARRVFLDTLKERGLREGAIKTYGVFSQTIDQLVDLQPSVVVTLGDSALKLLVPDAPKNTMNVRGYVFDTPYGFPVLASVDPEMVSKNWTPWRVLLSMDFQRAKDMRKKGWQRPERRVVVV